MSSKTRAYCIAMIQARMSSSRLPGKVLMELGGHCVLYHVIERLKQVQQLDDIIVVTSDQSEDEDIVAYCKNLGIASFQGPLNDVLQRYFLASKLYPSHYIARITADCPLICPHIIDQLIHTTKGESSGDLFTNVLTRTYPRGFDCEILSQALISKLAYHKKIQTRHREHVTLYCYENPTEFSIVEHRHDTDWSQYRLTLDTREDFELLNKIYTALYRPKQPIETTELMQFLHENPHLLKINKAVKQSMP